MAFDLKNIFGSILVNIALPAIKSYGGTALKDFLQKFHDQHPDTYKQTLVELYPVIDVQLENYAKSTSSTVDDDLVGALKKAIEESAAANGVTLPNLDAD